ncbi:MAG TPA: hypothetical protein VG733_06510 [Chthoniobacteraceae bacterium]|nr:hypothetical protein [Chthoniobacteraceae bacterium]
MNDNAQLPRIVFQIQNVDSGGAWGELAMFAEDALLMRAQEYPLTMLSGQLSAWSDRVDDNEHCAMFCLDVSGHPEFLGTFRIEPRPKGWQFTAINEIRRHEKLFTLNECKQMVSLFREQLLNALDSFAH